MRKTTVVEYTPGDSPEDRVSRGNAQKARTLTEEKAAWGRRLRRYRRKAVAGGTSPEDVTAALRAAAALPPEAVNKDATGLAFLRFKAERAIGADATQAAFAAAIGA